VFLWDVTTGRVIRKYTGHTTVNGCVSNVLIDECATQRVNSVKFNSESTLIFSGAYDRHVRIWDTKSNSFQSVQVLTGDSDCARVCIKSRNIDATDSISEVVLRNTELITR
jgi:mitogen-activated protein kinase organizer 1